MGRKSNICKQPRPVFFACVFNLSGVYAVAGTRSQVKTTKNFPHSGKYFLPLYKPVMRDYGKDTPVNKSMFRSDKEEIVAGGKMPGKADVALATSFT